MENVSKMQFLVKIPINSQHNTNAAKPFLDIKEAVEKLLGKEVDYCNVSEELVYVNASWKLIDRLDKIVGHEIFNFQDLTFKIAVSRLSKGKKEKPHKNPRLKYSLLDVFKVDTLVQIPLAPKKPLLKKR